MSARPSMGGQRQRGAVLLVGLIILIVLTLVVLGTMRTAIIEEKATGNLQDGALALQGAEAGLREGEQLLAQATLPPFDGSAAGLYGPPPADGSARWSHLDWDAAGAAIAASSFRDAPGSLARVRVQYFIEALPPVVAPGQSLAADFPAGAARFYRVTARAVAPGGASVILQSTFERPA